MAMLLSEIQWSDPVLPVAHDLQWEAELKRRGAQVLEVDRRVAPSRWLREAAYEATNYVASALPERLLRIGNMVTAQENSCRYCYGANRAYMKILGYSESFISRLERELHVAELDDMERAFIAFCRNLARSRPRPARADRDALVQLGYSPLAVQEVAFEIAVSCFYNRVGVLSACPPELGFERMANGPMGRLLGLAAPLMRVFSGDAPRGAPPAALDAG